MKWAHIFELAPAVLDKMAHGGVFFTVKDKSGRVNTMNIGWGGISEFWGKPVFIAPIRHNRYTYELLKDADCFTVSVPLSDGLDKALAYVGTHHGNEVDKFKEAHITPVDALSVPGAVIAQCTLHIECRIRLMTEMALDQMDADTRARCYGDNDAHTLYFGEVIACYRTDEDDT